MYECLCSSNTIPRYVLFMFLGAMMATTFQYIREGTVEEENRRLKAAVERDGAAAVYLQEVEAHNLTRRKLHVAVYYAALQLLVMIVLVIQLIGVNTLTKSSSYEDEFVKTEL